MRHEFLDTAGAEPAHSLKKSPPLSYNVRGGTPKKRQVSLYSVLTVKGNGKGTTRAPTSGTGNLKYDKETAGRFL